MSRTSQLPSRPQPSRQTPNKQRARRSLLSIYNNSLERRRSLNKRNSENTKFRKIERSSFVMPITRVATHPDAPTFERCQLNTMMVEVVQGGVTKFIEFEYDLETKIRELIDKIKSEIKQNHVVLRSGILTVDYLLTLGHERVTEFAGENLQLIAQTLKVSEAPVNSLKHFMILKCIGSGGFSKVYLAECYGVYMALKIINKKRVVQTQKHAIIENQKDILLDFRDHPFITKLHYSIQTEKTIVFAMEFCSGGELFHLLKKVRRMAEHQARFYFMEVLSALIALHDQGIVYRDLKPENIVIDSDGHIRLADFGLSKRCVSGAVNNSFCGSAEYMAPEMIERKDHGVQLDVYCLGALLYELITGLPPFFSKQSDKMFYSIVNNPVTFPSDVSISKNAKKLMINLLNKDPQQRMTALEILKDPWLQGATLEKINAKKFSPPFKPYLLSYNFDDTEFAANESEDMVVIYEEREAGDLVLPLFRKFYYQSDFMKNLKQSFKEPIEVDLFAKKPTLRKVSLVKLRTESSSSHTATQKLKKICNTRSPFNPRQSNNLSNNLRKTCTTEKSAWLFKAVQQQKQNLQKQNRPNIKKSYRSKDFIRKLYAR